jgi:hypothetical protein
MNTQEQEINGYLQFSNEVMINYDNCIIDYIRSEGFNIITATADIKNDLMSWVKAGILLKEIKQEFAHFILKNNLAKSWKEYCLKFFNLSTWQCQSLIDASKVVVALMKQGFTNILPNCVAQAIEMIKLVPDYECGTDYEIKEKEEELKTAWQEVINISKEEKKPITKNMVLKVVDPEKLENGGVMVKLPKQLKDKLQELALESNHLTIAEYLESLVISQQIVGEEIISNEETKERDQLWEEDLQDLIKEHDPEFKGFGKEPQPQPPVVKTIKQSTQVKNSFSNFGLKIIDTIIRLFDSSFNLEESDTA